MSLYSQKKILWRPHPKQAEALKKPQFEILYGGSRGGGKTDAGIAWLLRYVHNKHFRGLVLRRNAEDLKDWIDRANQLYSQLGAIKSGNPPEFRWGSGAIIRTGHLKDSDAYTKYQGHEYQKILIEELTHIPEEKNYLRILSSARSVHKELKPQVFLTTNPGGSGHLWVKERFVDPAIPGTTIWDGKRSRIFIPATMDDNPTLMKNDPQYVANIEALKESDPDTYRAWRYGDWEVFAGQVFRELKRRTHVIPRMIPKKSFTHLLWIDWGYSENSAFAATMNSLASLKTADGQNYNQIVTYKEWYGNQQSPREWARKIFYDCQKMDRKPNRAISDPAMHSPLQSGDRSIASIMMDEWKKLNNDENWCIIERGSNSGRNSRVNRVGMMHEWLSINPVTKVPYWVMTENCVNFIRTVPHLVHDENLVEAYDTSGEDHMADQSSYGLEKVKFISVKPGSLMPGITPMKPIFDSQGRQLAITGEQWFEEEPEEVDWRTV